jgi:DNA polymerase I-like protein with 3'-5' exonuclease and polymerase domains
MREPQFRCAGEPVLARVHCSLNLNTETGRLSARRPNLQNQPALEKDRYKVRCQPLCMPSLPTS